MVDIVIKQPIYKNPCGLWKHIPSKVFCFLQWTWIFTVLKKIIWHRNKTDFLPDRELQPRCPRNRHPFFATIGYGDGLRLELEGAIVFATTGMALCYYGWRKMLEPARPRGATGSQPCWNQQGREMWWAGGRPCWNRQRHELQPAWRHAGTNARN